MRVVRREYMLRSVVGGWWLVAVGWCLVLVGWLWLGVVGLAACISDLGCLTAKIPTGSLVGKVGLHEVGQEDGQFVCVLGWVIWWLSAAIVAALPFPEITQQPKVCLDG